jgi:uncharacterized membrane protein YgcG
MSDIERELESELHRVLDPVASMPIPARRAVRSAGPVKTLLGGAGAALTVKILTGVAVAAAAVTVAGAATTHSLNPSAWGRQVQQTVQTVASQRSQSVRSEAPQQGNGSAQGGNSSKTKGQDNGGTGHGNGNAQGKSDGSSGNDQSHGKDKPTDPTDPSSHGTPHVSPKP